MISAKDADALIARHVSPTPSERVPLFEAHGRVLRETLCADRDFPPFHRVAMDGIAISSAECGRGRREFQIAFTQAAGAPAQALPQAEVCAEVMTGAVLPVSSDCVVPVECITVAKGVATLKDDIHPSPMDNVHALGSDRTKGDALLRPGQPLYAPQIAVAATVGASMIAVAALPRIAIVSTGDELVDVDANPEPHQIRRSNVHAIEASLRLAGFTNICAQYLKDDAGIIRESLQALSASCDMLILSGGMSAGRFDHVPDVLRSLKAHIIFHQVSIRPGKPFLFAKASNGTAIFGLPGNPVSALVCLQRFVLPALHHASIGESACLASRPTATLSDAISFNKSLTLFTPVRYEFESEGTIAVPVPMNGSGDLAGLADSDGFVELPAEETSFPAGTRCPAWYWSGYPHAD